MDSFIVLVNKERNISSNKVVNIVKNLLKAKKAGHLGTLDVLGEGLLPVTIGKATKLFDYYLTKDKVYKTIFKFGETTDTLDLEGQIRKTDDKIITLDMVNSAVKNFIGKYKQMPPQYSSKKLNGRKAYELARKGEEVLLKPKEVEIYDFKCLRQLETNKFEFEVHCSSGTYIRSLCRDLAEVLSTSGVMYAIQRTKCGGFDIKNSFTLEQIKNNEFEKVEIESLFDYPKIELTTTQFEKLRNGKCDFLGENGFYKVYFEGNYLGNVKIENNEMKFVLRLCL